jgi:signal transduction histidine kinase
MSPVCCSAALLLAVAEGLCAQPASVPGVPARVLTNVQQLRRAAAGPTTVPCSFRLDGIVLWAGPERDQFILQDGSGAMRFQMSLRGQPALQTGQPVHVEGRGFLGGGIVRDVLIDNDGLHPPVEKSAAVYLSAGQHPIRLDWFNGPDYFELKVEYEGPGMPRQKIPDVALSGLNFHGYEGRWDRLPDFQRLVPVKTGTATNFNLTHRSRNEQVGLQFTGFLTVPSNGLYTFWLDSDDGSRLYLGETSLRVSPSGYLRLPAARRLVPGQPLAEDDDCRWSEVEGTLTSMHVEPGGGLEAELNAGTNRMYLDIVQVAGRFPALFSRVRATGICRASTLTAGQPMAGRLMVPDLNYLETLSPGEPNPLGPRIGTVSQLRHLTLAGQSTIYPLHLEGLVLAASPDRGLLALQLDTGAVLVELDRWNQVFQPGERIALEGNCTFEGNRLIVHPAALVDNDGVHGATEKTGSILLQAGKHAIHLSWFNLDQPSELGVYYQGPDLPRQRIPGSALFRPEKEAVEGPVRWVAGLHYRVYEGSWLRVPSFGRLDPAKEGTTTNFDISVATRPARVGLDFNSFLDVPRDGVYTFSTISDDGSLLFIGEQPTRLTVLGTNAPPRPTAIFARQVLSEQQEDCWAQVEGRVTFANRELTAVELELTSGAGHMRVEIADATGVAPRLLLNSRVRATGICQATYTTDGERVAGLLLAPDIKQVEILELAPVAWTDYPLQSIRHFVETSTDSGDAVVHIRGTIRSGGPGAAMIIEDQTGFVPIELPQRPPPTNGCQIELLGAWSRSSNNSVLRCAFIREALATPTQPANPGLPQLTSIEQVKGLSRQEAERGYPVKIRGIITTPLVGGFFIQDATWAIYVRAQDALAGETPRAGDYWEVEGVTFTEFAPNIRARRAIRLGSGTMPEPLHPTWDQLNNGSLDTCYVEIQGVVTGIAADGMALLTRAGKLRVELADAEPGSLQPYLNALIRVRGCVIPGRDIATQEIELGHIRLSNFSVNLDEPAPADLFSATSKSVADLRLFDPRAGALERVRLSGQILHGRHGEYFLLQGTNGFHFVPQTPADFQPGDLVEAVGFADLAGPSPVLREAIARRTGTAPLPSPQSLSENSLLSASHDSRLVRLEARLANVSSHREDQVLELQAGTRGFVARLEARNGLLGNLASGSRLELTGVYVGLGGDRAAGRDIDSFELLLNSAAVRVLASPPWWNLRHTLTVVSAMTVIILAAVVWITLLRRQVEERSHQLAVAIQHQEQTERQRALEQERSRIAQDLHDDLGATLTQIRLLSALESRDAQVPSATRSRMSQVTEKSRQMVASLDEIVWAVNPANDSLPQLATYFCQFAEELFRPTNIRCRLDVADPLPLLPLTSEVRHNLYLAVREALNNVVKHSRASEVWLRIHWLDGALRIALEDNGCGFEAGPATATGEGLANLRRRLEKIGGHFEYDSKPSAGTTCRIWLPLNA